MLDYLYTNCQEKSVVLSRLLPLLLNTILPDVVDKSTEVTASESQEKTSRNEVLFKFFSQTVLKSKQVSEVAASFDFISVSLRIAKMITHRPILEHSQSQKDFVLIGLMTLLKDIIGVSVELR